MNIFEKVNKFINKKSKDNKIIVIYWPTWAWKTDMSIDIAKKLNTEIISTDSSQIFKYMNIWTWKIKEEEKKWIAHHMIDIITPDINYSVWEFKKESETIINKLHKQWKIPLLVWWTWLYIDSLIYDFKIPKVSADKEIREKLEKELKMYWKDFIFDKLKSIDPIYANTIHKNNSRYIIRAIEIKTITWKSKLEFREEKKLKYDILFLIPDIESREFLYKRINKRVENMFEEWWIDEVKNLINMWYDENSFWMKSIWYKEIIEYIKWEETKQNTIEKVQLNTRNYAKRQLTWFRKYPSELNI